MKKTVWSAALCALAACMLSACGVKEADVQFYAMDTAMSAAVYGARAQQAVQAVQEELFRLDALLSRTRADSAVSQLNQSGSADGGGEVAALVTAAEEYSAATGGAFDVTVAPVADAWGFTKEEKHVPAQSELDALLPLVGSGHVHLSEDGLELDEGTQIDLGGIAKGYAADRTAALLAENGVAAASVSLGGNIYVRGCKPDGSAWRVGIQDPARSGGFAGVLSLTDAFAVTSGGYQRYFEQDGKTYHHILDPATGWPAESGLTSVTIVADEPQQVDGTPGRGAMCDALSTALFVMGEEEAVRFWRSGAYAFEFVLVTEDGRVLVSEGLADRFEQEADSGYAYETIPAA